MVLPVNLTTPAEELTKFSQARAANAQADSAEANAMQQMAETRDYVSQVQKDKRSAQAQADTTAAMAEKAKNQVILNNPDLYASLIKSGMQDDLQKHAVSLGNSTNQSLIQNFSPLLADASPESYKKLYSQALLSPNGAEMVKTLPSVADYAKDPQTMGDKVKLLMHASGTALAQSNAEYQVKSQLQDQEDQDKLGQIAATGKIESAIEDKRTAAASALEDKRGKFQIQAANISSAWHTDTANIRAQATVDAANIRADVALKKLRGQKLSLSKDSGMSGGMQGTIQAVGSSVKGQANDLGMDIGDTDLHALVTNSVIDAQQEWTKQKDAYESGDSKASPTPVPELAIQIAQDQLIHAKAAGGKTGGMFSSDKLGDTSVLTDPNLDPEVLEAYAKADTKGKQKIITQVKQYQASKKGSK